MFLASEYLLPYYLQLYYISDTLPGSIVLPHHLFRIFHPDLQYLWNDHF